MFERRLAEWLPKKFQQSSQWLDTGPRAFLRRLVEKALRYGGAFVDLVIGSGSEYDPKSKLNGIASLVTFQAMLVTQALGLVVYAQNENSQRVQVWLIYLALSLFPILGMIRLMRTQTANSPNGTKRFAHDQATMQFGRRSQGLSALLVVFMIVVCAFGYLSPSHETVNLKVVDAKEYIFTKSNKELGITENDRGAMIYASITPRDFRGLAYPDPLVVDIELQGELKKSWGVAATIGLDGDETSQKKTDHVAGMVEDHATDQKTVIWQGLEPGRRYTLAIRLYKIKPGIEGDLIEMAKDSPDKVIRVNAYYPK